MANPYTDLLDLSDEFINRIELFKKNVRLAELNCAPVADLHSFSNSWSSQRNSSGSTSHDLDYEPLIRNRTPEKTNGENAVQER